MSEWSLSSESGRSTAIVSTYGAQVLSWCCRGQEQLFVASESKGTPGSAVRGGVPVIFPQFGSFGRGARHGFARVREWEWGCAGRSAPHRARFVLRQDEATLEIWPHHFEAVLDVQLPDDERLSIQLAVRNSGDSHASFTAALHTYLRIDDVAHVQLIGLRGTEFLDATDSYARRIEHQDWVRFEGEIDRIYMDVPPELAVRDASSTRTIRQSGFIDTVVWNPGAALASTLPDLQAGDHERFVCIEAACVATPVWLPPGECWHGTQLLIG